MRSLLVSLSAALFSTHAFAALVGTASVLTQVTSASDSLNTVQQISNASVPAALHDSVAHTLPARGVPVTTVIADAAVDWNAGQLRASASASLANPCLVNNLLVCTGGTGTVKSRAYAQGTLIGADVTFTGNAQDPTVPFTTSANLALSGQILRAAFILEGDTQSYYNGSSVPDSVAHFRYQLSQSQPRINPDKPNDPPLDVGVTLASGSIDLTAHYDGTLTYATGGFAVAPANWSNGSHVYTTTPFQIYANRPVSLVLAAELDSGEQYSIHEFDDVSAALLFGSTFGVATSGAVFNGLAAGVNVASLDLGIVGNQFVQSVPVPASAALLALAMGTLTRVRRRRGQT